MQHSLYVFEGVDGSGKTSLGKSFANRINGVYYKGLPKFLKPFKNFVDKNLPPRLRYLYYSLGNRIVYKELRKLLKHQDVIVDQYTYCTMAFHSVSLRKKLRLSIPITPKYIVYLRAPWTEIDKRLNERGGRKRLEDLDYLKQVDKEYQRIFEGMQNVVYFDTTGRNIEENTQLLYDKFIRE